MTLSPLFLILILLVAFDIIILTFGKSAKTRLAKQYPPIGQMIDIGGYRLHMHVEGEGSPTVILDSGAGGIGLAVGTRPPRDCKSELVSSPMTARDSAGATQAPIHATL